MWQVPSKVSSNIKKMAKNLGCEWVGAIKVDSNSAYEYDDCHNSVLNYASIYGGDRILSYYFVEGFDEIQAIKHSIWKYENTFIDIMPYRDGRKYNIIGRLPKCYNNYTISNAYFHSLDKYLKQESEMSYYVYQLVNPIDNKPFYIGKGTGNRAQHHLREKTVIDNVYKQNKIDYIRSQGYEPRIEIIAENIIDENLAYKIETEMIKKYGRKGYDEGGILTNICLSNLPPSHKGKTYEEIYGDRAEEQRRKRHQLQLDAGGWFKGRRHTDESKKKISQKTSGKNNPRYGVKVSGTDIAKKIGTANRGKKHYHRKDVKLLFIEGLDVFIFSNDLRDFCVKNNYSLGTFQKQLSDNWPVSKRGKNIGLKIRLATPEEITSYISGGTKQDIDDTTFKGFSL